MKRAPAAVLVACVVSSSPACSLFTSLDGLSGGSVSDAGNSGDESVSTDAGSDVSAGEGGDAAIDAGPEILSCTTKGLVAFWGMNEGSGTIAHDCAGGFDGNFSDSNVTWGTRNGGGSLELTALGYVTMGTVPQLQPAGAFTIAGWYRSDLQPADFTSLFWNYDGGTLQGFEITLGPDNHLYAQIGFGNANAEANFPAPITSTWMHLAVVYEPGVRLETYFDGMTFDKETTIATDGGALPPTGVTPDDHEVRFGADDPDSTWHGGIDDIRFFTRALTPAEIKVLSSN